VLAWVDGEWVEEEAGRVPIHDRGFLYGDGVYDTCRLYHGRWLRFDDHARRLHESADVLGITPPPVPELRRLADQILARNAPQEHAVLRMTVTRGGGRHDDRAPDHRLVLTLAPLPADWRDRARRGWSCLTADVRHPPPAVMPPRLKGQGRIFSLLARREAEAAGCDQALLLSLDGQVTEGATWNVFWRRGDTIRTPAESTGILAGVTRGVVIDCVEEAGYALEVGVWDRRELDDADEIFGTMTSLGLVPIHTLDGRALPPARPAVERLTSLYWQAAAS
jgi:branched-subunit amino acid aminotransferase/4-amino-4-deoxychorismate lyase